MRVAITAPKREIVEQLAGRLRGDGCRVGVVAPWEAPDYDAPVQVASVPSLVSRLRAGHPVRADLLLEDECHHGVAGQWREIHAAFPDARRLGLTATPARLDGRGLSEAYDTLVEGPSIEELIDGGFLVRPRTWAPAVPDLEGVRRSGADWSRGDLERLLARRGAVADALGWWRKIAAPDARTVAVCVSVEHARALADEFAAAGVRSGVLLGCQKDGERKEALERFAAGDLDLLASVDCLIEGVDVPACDTLLMCRPTLSEIVWRQAGGRPLRLHPGKTEARIIDLAGCALRHGTLDETPAWTLEGGAQRKRPAVNGEASRRCSACFGVWAAAEGPVCPYCGSAPAPRQRTQREIQAELREIEKAEAQRLAKARRGEEARARTLEDWLAIAKARGYQPGWAFQRHRLRQARSGR